MSEITQRSGLGILTFYQVGRCLFIFTIPLVLAGVVELFRVAFWTVSQMSHLVVLQTEVCYSHDKQMNLLT